MRLSTRDRFYTESEVVHMSIVVVRLIADGVPDSAIDMQSHLIEL